MRRNFLKFLSCPRCLETLELNEIKYNDIDIIRGNLNCSNCLLNFNIEQGVPIFGLKLNDKNERLNEIKAENEWTFSANDMQTHIQFAKTSSLKGTELIDHIESFDKNQHQQKNVLDIGSGWGCFQAWQFAKRGYNVAATELCPEFIFASDNVARDCHFERVITDCTVLPFKNQSFDVVYCKETLHHINNPSSLLDEMWRVCSPNGLILIEEPCVSSLLKTFIAKINRAKKIGISHHFRTSNEYIKLMKDITCKTEVDSKSYIETSQSLPHIPFSNFINNVAIYLIGCQLEVLGAKRMEYIPEFQVDREVIPIKIDKMNIDQIKFYRDELIPKAFNYFQ